MTNEEKELIVYCLKANSDFHGEVCEECKNYPKCDHFQADSLMEKLIEALEQESCEDAVSRQAVKEQMIYYGFLAPDMTVTEFVEDCLPSVDPYKTKTGNWEQYGNFWEDKFKCSECGKEQPKILCGERIIGHWSDYCPNCGAKMVEPKESEVEDGNDSR